MTPSFALVFVLFVQTVLITFGQNFTDPACVDGQLTSSVEYEHIARYKTIYREENNKTYSCYLITQCSMDRLSRLASQIKGWQGAASVAVFIPTPNSVEKLQHINTVDKFLIDLHKDPDYNGRLTVSLLFGHEGYPELWNCTEVENSPGFPLYPINALRNLAVAAATGEDSHHQSTPKYILYSDVDFVPSAGLSDWVDKQDQGNGTFHQLMRNGDLIVIPAFESSATVPPTPTRSLHYLLEGIMDDKIHQFHGGKRYPAGHNMTDYHRWRSLSLWLGPHSGDYPFQAYEVTYQPGAEPYVIMAKSAWVPYDERFRGYGLNKCVQLQWFAEHKRTFHVQPGHFLVEDKHPNSKLVGRAGKTAHLIMVAYRAVRQEMSAGKLPLVSRNTSQLLIAAGYEKVATEVPETHEAFWRGLEYPIRRL